MQGIEVVGAYSGDKCWIPHHAIMCVTQVNQSDGVRTIIWLTGGQRLSTKLGYEAIVAMLEDTGDE